MYNIFEGVEMTEPGEPQYLRYTQRYLHSPA